MQSNCLSTEELRDLFTFHEKSRYSSFFPYLSLPVVIYKSRHFKLAKSNELWRFETFDCDFEIKFETVWGFIFSLLPVTDIRC